jgi:hypothetical protein
LIVWGSGRYRDSNVYVAAVPLDRVGDPDTSAWRYYTAGDPPWSPDEQKAAALLNPPNPKVGELSGSWVPALGAWLLMYNSETRGDRGIWGHVAPQPWGPWSAGTLLFGPRWAGLGYGNFMHEPGVDNVSDPGREDQYGGEYGPYLIDRFTTPVPSTGGGRRAKIHFVMSTWNPYNTVLMRAAVEVVS